MDKPADKVIAIGLRGMFVSLGMVAALLSSCIEGSGMGGGRQEFIAVPQVAITQSAGGADSAIDWSGYAEALVSCVDEDGRVDYFRLAQPPLYPKLLTAYGLIAQVSPLSRPDLFPNRSDMLAYYINAHNLLALKALAPYFGPGKVDPRRVSDLPVAPETGFVFELEGSRVTLDDIRRQRIVPLLGGDPTPLLGLCAGRRNDPPLRREPYRGDTLKEQLADQLDRVLRDEAWCRIDHLERRVFLPAAIAEHREYYWAGYLAKPGRSRKDVRFLTVLMDWADPSGRAWLNRATDYEVATARPANLFNNQALLAALEE